MLAKRHHPRSNRATQNTGILASSAAAIAWLRLCTSALGMENSNRSRKELATAPITMTAWHKAMNHRRYRMKNRTMKCWPFPAARLLDDRTCRDCPGLLCRSHNFADCVRDRTKLLLGKTGVEGQ